MVLRAKSRDSGSTSARSIATCRWAAARSRLSRETVERGIWVNLAISRTPKPESKSSPMALSSTSFPAIVNAWWYRRARRHMLTASSQSSGNDPAPSASIDCASQVGQGQCPTWDGWTQASDSSQVRCAGWMLLRQRRALAEENVLTMPVTRLSPSQSVNVPVIGGQGVSQRLWGRVTRSPWVGRVIVLPLVRDEQGDRVG